MRGMQLAKKLKQGVWVVLAMPSRGEAAHLDREETGVGPVAGRNSVEAIEKEGQYLL